MDVGVVIPARAPAPYLEAAVASVRAQDAPVVVVDDGSDPPLPAMPDVTWIRRAATGGPGAARNEGVRALRTEWVGFCDADDEWLPGKLAAQERALAQAPAVSVCAGAAEIVDEAGVATGERWDPLEDPERLYEGNPVLLSSVLVRRSVFSGSGGFDEALSHAEDWDLWLRLARDGAEFLSVSEARVRYRRHAGGLTADVAALARAQLLVHRRYAQLVAPEVARRAQHRDLLALAEGLLRERRHREARQALREAAGYGPVPWERRARLVPGVRALAGRRDPYRRRG